MINIKDQRLSTSLHHKPTPTNSLLHFQSFHPTHVKKCIPTGQYLHVKRNCTEDEDFWHHARDLSARFLDREYPWRVLLQAFMRAKHSQREDLLQARTRPEDKTLLRFSITSGGTSDPLLPIDGAYFNRTTRSERQFQMYRCWLPNELLIYVIVWWTAILPGLRQVWDKEQKYRDHILVEVAQFVEICCVLYPMSLLFWMVPAHIWTWQYTAYLDCRYCLLWLYWFCMFPYISPEGWACTSIIICFSVIFF